MVSNAAFINENALIADQLSHYVRAVSGIRPILLEGFPFYLDDGHGVLVCMDGKSDFSPAANAAVELALKTPGLNEITVLACASPRQAPDSARISEDCHWLLDLPVKPGQKTRNMLRKAGQFLELQTANGSEALTEEHQGIIREFKTAKKENLDDGTCFIFDKLSHYLSSAPGVTIFSAKSRERLEGFAIADYSSLNWAFYMFAFRRRDALPGTADFLLQGLISHAETLGYDRLNLGLGINPGVMFFKRKWGAKPLLRHIETSWQIPPHKPLLARLAAKFLNKN